MTDRPQQFRKKPVVIEAIQYAGHGNMNPRGGLPDWLWEAFEKGDVIAPGGDDPLFVVTLEGKMLVSPGDWIIRGVKGEVYPCKPDIFAATYEPVDEGARMTEPIHKGHAMTDQPQRAESARASLVLSGDGRVHHIPVVSGLWCRAAA